MTTATGRAVQTFEIAVDVSVEENRTTEFTFYWGDSSDLVAMLDSIGCEDVDYADLGDEMIDVWGTRSDGADFRLLVTIGE